MVIACLLPGVSLAAGHADISGPTLVQIYNTPELKAQAVEAGEPLFQQHCSSCHAADGTGSPGVPDISTGIFMWGGSLSDLEVTIRYGIRSGHEFQRYSEMPAYTDQDFLSKERINDLVEYVLSIAYQDADKSAVDRAAGDFEQICSECHDYAGTGRKEYYGAPDLTDFSWQYGNSRETLFDTIAKGRKGVSPAFDQALDNEAIKDLTVYIYDKSHY